MKFDTESYINTLLDNFARNHAYYSYLKLKNVNVVINILRHIPKICYQKNISFIVLLKKMYLVKTLAKKVSWDTKLFVEYNY